MRIQWTTEHIDEIISLSLHQHLEAPLPEREVSEEGSQGAELGETIQSYNQIRINLDQLTSPSKPRSRSHKQRVSVPRTPHQVVKPLAVALNGETWQLFFPLLTVHRICAEILREIHRDMDPTWFRICYPRGESRRGVADPMVFVVRL